MSCFMGRSLNGYVKLYVSNKTYSQKFFSALYPANHKVINFKIKENRLKLNQVNELQYRNLSFQGLQNFYIGFYDSVTSSSASQLLKETLIQCHDITGLHWWGIIVLATSALKLFVALPMGVYQQYLIAKIKNSKIELDEIAKRVKEEVLIVARRERWTKQKANLELNRQMRKHWNVVIVKNNCHPFKIVIVGLSQLPLWLLLSFTLRKFASDINLGTSDTIVPALQFQVGGVFWSPNLILPDSTLILPTIITLFNLAIIEVNSLSNTHVINLYSKISKNFFRLLSLLAFGISANIPSCVSLFWAVSTMFAFAQSLLLLHPKFRRFCRIPKTSNDLDKPYSVIYNRFMEKWTKIGMKLKVISKK